MTEEPVQPTLPGLARRKPRVRVRTPAEVDPVASVLVDTPAPHLDHPFDYLVPADLSETAVPGVPVKVPFGGQDLSGYVLARTARADIAELAYLQRVVSPVSLLTPQTYALARNVAKRYAGTTPDVLRLAIPPRHARIEATIRAASPGALTPPAVDPNAWQPYRGGPAFLRHLTAGRSPRAVWTALPGANSPWAPLAAAVVATLTSGRSAVVIVPTGRQLALMAAALATAGVGAWSPNQPGRLGFARLQAEDGAELRYAAFLAAKDGFAPVVIGTRAAVFAPVPDLGLIAIWDDGSDLYDEPRAPYPHTRVVAEQRAAAENAALLLAGWTRTAEAQLLLETQWAAPVAAPREVVRAATPRVHALGSRELAAEGPAASAHLPTPVLRAIREALTEGPVLVQVPRSGYVPATSCSRCRTPARCRACHGPLGLDRPDLASCRWCGAIAGNWRCDVCGGPTLRADRIGSGRTADEIGRAVRGAQIIQSSGDTRIRDEIPGAPAIVVATPGAEPSTPGGYRLAVLLDARTATARTELNSGQEALRRWFAAAALVRPHEAGGQVLVVGDGAPRVSQALVRWDPATFAAEDLAERRDLGFPPTVRMATLIGDRPTVDDAVTRLELPDVRILGPVVLEAGATDGLLPAADTVRALVAVPLESATELVDRLTELIAARSARRDRGSLRIQVDPKDLT
jgi:primosomal protein N' (replication factor Y)